eukprot:1724995-Prymnesium_polylepis.1
MRCALPLTYAAPCPHVLLSVAVVHCTCVGRGERACSVCSGWPGIGMARDGSGWLGIGSGWLGMARTRHKHMGKMGGMARDGSESKRNGSRHT